MPDLPSTADSPVAADQEEELVLDDMIPTRGYHTLPVVGVGGSAGSIAALQTFFGAVPPDTGMAYVVIIHLSPNHESSLAGILQKHTLMPVVQVTDYIKVEPDRVYVIPPRKHLLMRDGHLHLGDQEYPKGKRVAVDMFFRTLADTHGPHAAAIVLSGADGDGSIGIKRIKERGGLTIAQDPQEAENPEMPRAALGTGMVDWVLKVKDMPERIACYRKNEKLLRLPPEEEPVGPEARKPTEGSLREVLAFLCMRTGHDFTSYKRATILRRLARRMQVNSVADLTEYLAFLRTHPGETGALLQDLLISVTNFFRDRDAFHGLEAQLGELLHGRNSTDEIRVWVVACATGEEAYSLAMLLSEQVERMHSRPKIQIFATDIDEHAIQVAREGKYPETIAADISEERLRRFFTHEQGCYRVKREIRETVLFAMHNVLKDSPFSRLDLITCRNLLIYLDRKAQTDVFSVFHFALRGKGMLFLGSSESVEEGKNHFEAVDKGHRIYSKKATHRADIPMMFGSPSSYALQLRHLTEGPVVTAAGTATPVQRSTPPLAHHETSPAFSWDALHFKMLDGLIPPSLLVNSAYDIVHLSEGCGRFLKFIGGKSTNNLLRLVLPALRVELRAALFRAVQTAAPVQVRGIQVEMEGEARVMDISVRPAQELSPDLLLVIFEEGQKVIGEVVPALVPSGVVQNLEHEIEHLRQQLRDTVEQYEASAEELKASNEELQAMNEELRSATEELETSREELQSINEELTTVNLELKSKVQELSYTNSDLQNLMASTHIATIFLDRQLCIKRYTPSAVSLFNLIVTDIGRPLSDLRHRLEYDTLTRDAERVLHKITPVNREVADVDGRSYLAQMLPYRNEEQVAGVVLTFIDITDAKLAEKALRENEERLMAMFEHATVGQSELDAQGKILRVNDELCRILGRRRDELLELDMNAITHPDDVRACEEALKNTVTKGTRSSLDKRFLRPDGSTVYVNSSLSRIGSQARPTGVLAVVVDLTQRRVATLELEESRGELEKALREAEKARASAEQADQTKNRFLAVLSHELRTPLTPVLMSVQTALDDPDLSPEMRESLEMIERNVVLETVLIADLLDISRITHGKMEINPKAMDLHEAIQRAVDVCRNDFFLKHQHLELHLQATQPRLQGDLVRLQQVFWNLLKNAAKFTCEKGRISIRSFNEAGHIRVEITDNGIGIHEDDLPYIFNPFAQGGRTVTKQYGGLGLGLAISIATVHAHGGTLQAESKGAGKGTTFIVSLPI